MTNHNLFNKIAVINDMTGFGRCALSVEMPIISHMGIQCCPVPTSILSNHSAFSSFYFDDYTDNMSSYISEWEKLSLQFEGILTGFYGSTRQIDIVCDFINIFSKPDTVVIVDPIMGDNGKIYKTYTDEMCDKMRELVGMADIITPNFTELCILAKRDYDETLSYTEIEDMCKNLKDSRLKSDCRIVVTGIKRGSYIVNMVYDNGKAGLVRKKTAGDNRCGTGDVFASVIAGKIVNGCKLTDAVKIAADFVSKCIKESDKIGIPKTDGVCFEKILNQL